MKSDIAFAKSLLIFLAATLLIGLLLCNPALAEARLEKGREWRSPLGLTVTRHQLLTDERRWTSSSWTDAR